MTVPDAQTRWLTDKPSGPLTFPTDIHSKQSVKHVATTGLSALGTSHSFPGVNFGLNFTGRRIVALIYAVQRADVATAPIISSLSIGGGANDTSPPVAWASPGGTAIAAVVGGHHTPSGTSGTISFTTNINLRCVVVVLSVSNLPAATPSGNSAGFIAHGATGAGGTINIPSNGLTYVAVAKTNGNSISMSGITIRGQSTPLSGTRIAWGWDNRMGTQSNRSISFSSSGNATCAIGMNSRTQG